MRYNGWEVELNEAKAEITRLLGLIHQMDEHSRLMMIDAMNLVTTTPENNTYGDGFAKGAMWHHDKIRKFYDKIMNDEKHPQNEPVSD